MKIVVLKIEILSSPYNIFFSGLFHFYNLNEKFDLPTILNISCFKTQIDNSYKKTIKLVTHSVGLQVYEISFLFYYQHEYKS